MSETIQFFYNPMSRARVTLWMLEEVGAPYEIKHVDLEKRENKLPEFLKLNPMGKLPTIVHRGTVVTESAAICTYLADAFPQANLAPGLDDPQRGTYLRWLFFAAGPAESAMMDRSFPRETSPSSVTIGYGMYEDMINAMEQALAPGPYLLGERFTAADLYLAGLIGWGMFSKSIDPKPVFERYVQLCSSRPAAKRAESIGAKYMKQG